ncbi:methyltransferase domain-containing protein [Fragilaria crotonensis]|nr:methyltransferase domain-containing protein [Fragilaria crotonensis]
MMAHWRVIVFLLATALSSSTSSALSLHAGDTQHAGKHWEIHQTIQKLERDGITTYYPRSIQEYGQSTADVVQVLKEWSRDHSGDDNWRSLLNKANLQNEVEESIVALHHLRKWTSTPNTTTPFIAVDVCCGKGLFSMLLSYVAIRHRDLAGLSRIILLDKDLNIDWRHVIAANQDQGAIRVGQYTKPTMEIWAGSNLHDYDSTILPKLQSYNQTIALTGIHLCKNLAPSLIGLANQLGPEIVPYLCLAPCCLPRRTALLKIGQYEPPMQRNVRLQMQQYRNAARQRRPTTTNGCCYVCQGAHHVRECPQQYHYADANDWNTAVATALAQRPCWNCGKLGHHRDECSERSAALIQQPVAQLTFLSLETQIHTSHFATFWPRLFNKEIMSRSWIPD